MPPTLSSSIPWTHHLSSSDASVAIAKSFGPSARKHTGASAIGDVHSDALYCVLPQLTHPLSSSRPRAHLPLPTPPSWSPFPKARHCDTVATAAVPEYPIPQTHCLFLVLSQRLCCRHRFCGPCSEILLTFGLLNSYFFL